MLKRNAIVKFVLISIIAVLGILLCVLPISVPYSSNQYNGFVNAINKSIELDGGVSAVYDCTLPEGSNGRLSEAIDNSLSNIENIFQTEKFRELYVERQGGNKVSILASSDAYTMNRAFDYIQDGKNLYFTAIQVSDTTANPEVYLNSDDVSSVKVDYDYDESTYGVVLNFKDSSKSDIEKIKSIAKTTSNKNIYVYLGEIKESCLLTEISYNDFDEKDLFITSSSDQFTTKTPDGARKIAYNIAGGMLEVNLNLLEVSKITPLLGKNTQLYLGISLLIIIFLAFVFLCIRYGDLGILGCLALVFYAVLFAFFMQAIPFINLTLSGVIGSIIAFMIAIFTCAVVFENIQSEYAIGKKIHLACKGGFKKSLWTIIDSLVVITLASIFIWVIAPASMKCFGITLILGALLSAFTSLVLLRIFVKNYLLINSTKAKRMHLYRDKNVIEIDDNQMDVGKTNEDVIVDLL